MLNVIYDPNTAYTFEFENMDPLPKLSQRIHFYYFSFRLITDWLGIQTIKEGIEALNMGAIRNDTLDFEDLKSWPALLFVRAYDSLMNVLYKSHQDPKSTPLPSTHTPQTPSTQMTIPANPNFSNESSLSATSTSSAASKAEHFTEKLCVRRSFVQINTAIS